MGRLWIIAAYIAFLPTVGFANDAKRYVVATKTHASARAMALTIRSEEPFRNFDGFAAELTPEEVRALAVDPNVVRIEEDAERFPVGIPHRLAAWQNIPGADGTQSALGTPGAEHTDSIFLPPVAFQYRPIWLTLLHADEACVITCGEGAGIAIIDTGISTAHPDFAGRVVVNLDMTTSPPTSDVQGASSHGSHTAGIAGAADNDVGIVGVASRAPLYIFNVAKASGGIFSSTIIKAMDWILSNPGKVRIVNISLGGSVYEESERQICAKVAKDALIFAAAGNDPTAHIGYPAAYPEVYAVTAIDGKKNLATFSSYGPEAAFTAPGVNIVSDVLPNDGLWTWLQTPQRPVEASLLVNSPEGSVSGKLIESKFGGPHDFPPAVSGNIAFTTRGGNFSFLDKAATAKSFDAIGVVIKNSLDELVDGFRLDPPPAAGTVPVTVSIAGTDGQALQQSGVVTSDGTSATVMIRCDRAEYDRYDGTSMSSPMVAGVAAVVWSREPRAWPQLVIDCMRSTAEDLGARGWDPRFGYGLPNAKAAGDCLVARYLDPPRRRAAGH